jgi:general secretion pathway protein L
VLRPESGLLVDDAGVAGTFDWASDSPAPLALRLALDEASARGERPARVHVHADRTALPDLARWSAECSVPLEPAQPWNEIAAQDPAAGAIELLTDAFAPRRSRIKSLRIPRAAMFVALAIALTQFGLTAADAWRLERERSALEARREAIFRTAFPEARAVVDPDLQMARNLAQLRRERGLDTADAFVTALGAAARESSTPAQSLDYANGRLTVRRAGSAR